MSLEDQCYTILRSAPQLLPRWPNSRTVDRELYFPMTPLMVPSSCFSCNSKFVEFMEIVELAEFVETVEVVENLEFVKVIEF